MHAVFTNNVIEILEMHWRMPASLVILTLALICNVPFSKHSAMVHCMIHDTNAPQRSLIRSITWFQLEALIHPRTICSHRILTLSHHPNIASLCIVYCVLCIVYYDGGDCASPFILPFGPSILGMGFLAAFTVFIRGTPWRTRGSFINVGSSFAGAVAN